MTERHRAGPDRTTRIDHVRADDSVGDAGVHAAGVPRAGKPPTEDDRRTKLDENQGNPVQAPGE